MLKLPLANAALVMKQRMDALEAKLNARPESEASVARPSLPRSAEIAAPATAPAAPAKRVVVAPEGADARTRQLARLGHTPETWAAQAASIEAGAAATAERVAKATGPALSAIETFAALHTTVRMIAANAGQLQTEVDNVIRASSISYDAFQSLSTKQKAAFCLRGGKIEGKATVSRELSQALEIIAPSASGLSITREAFAKLSPRDQLAHVNAGGKIN